MTLGSKKGLSKADIKSDKLMEEKASRLSEIMEEYKKSGVKSSHISQTIPLRSDGTKEVRAKVEKADKIISSVRTEELKTKVEQAEKFIDYAEKKMTVFERPSSIIRNVKPLLTEIERSLWRVSFIDQDLRKKINRIREAVRRAEREVRGI